MIIGIFVHSLTGNTYSVVEQLSRRLAADGHEVHIHRLTPVGGENTNITDISKFQLEAQPDISTYDFVVFAGPVRGFSMSPVINKCFSLIPSMQGKRTACLVTQQFPFPGMGGNRTIAQMQKECTKKGACVCATGIVNWKNKNREQKTAEIIDTICRAL